MKTLTVRIPESLFAEITREAVARKLSKSEVIRQRLEQCSAVTRSLLIDELDDLEAFELIARLLDVEYPGGPLETEAEQSAA
ncbi:MAG TPA: ribbon-helix-helix protein, CopG family [Chthoniobacter sp.]